MKVVIRKARRRKKKRAKPGTRSRTVQGAHLQHSLCYEYGRLFADLASPSLCLRVRGKISPDFRREFLGALHNGDGRT